MNLADSMRLTLALFDAHLRRDAIKPSKHLGSKQPRLSKTAIRERRKRQRQARRKQRG